ncbi:cytochrome P450 6k1 [Apis mellifera]|uniref:Cytochrome P450 6k1 n=1 Tax=Apis mellifera TaxID=7460 RepID=A0A7M7R984_APIME|nr:cytochrome P450 6k1 [Apis mellifera]XP_026302253.1 cytochrome P450 6k1 [Apis mellifera]XP_624795.3 cytochrome P450 6k1 [Apis mellifera]|eukprot:XP_016772837.1 cytochrome P450 6k1 [Apis mellifera]
MFLTTWLIPDIIAVASLITVGLYFYYKLYLFKFWHKKGIFYVKPSFPTGNIMPIINGKLSLAEFFRDIYEHNKHHRLVGIYMLYKPYLIVNDPNLIRDILTKEFTNFHDRGIFYNEEVDPLSGHLFQLPGKKWRNLRVKLTPTFTSGKIKQFFPILNEAGNILAKYLEEEARKGSTIDVKDIFARYSTDIIMSVAFGISCDSFKEPNNEFRYWGKKIFDPKPLWNALILFAPQILNFFSISYTEKSVTKFFTNMFKQTVKYRESNNIERKDFLNLLIQLMKNGYVDADDESLSNNVNAAKNKLTMMEAAAQAYVFFLAGFETSSTTVTFCLYELAKNQDIQNKVREEIQTMIKKNGDLTYNALNDMNYLHKVISETLRKYPPVVILNRICTNDVKLSTTDFCIPKGTCIAIPVFGLHRDSNIFPNPEKFDPERFSEENIKTRHPYVYLPFGEGPRICIGLRFGLIQTKIAIINALLKNKFKFGPNTPSTLEFEKGSLILIGKGGIHLNIEPI